MYIFPVQVTVRLQAVNSVQESLTARTPTAVLLLTVLFPWTIVQVPTANWNWNHQETKCSDTLRPSRTPLKPIWNITLMYRYSCYTPKVLTMYLWPSITKHCYHFCKIMTFWKWCQQCTILYCILSQSTSTFCLISIMNLLVENIKRSILIIGIRLVCYWPFEAVMVRWTFKTDKNYIVCKKQAKNLFLKYNRALDDCILFQK